MTCGPYRPVTLTTYTARIQEVNAHAFLSADMLVPTLKLDVTFTGSLAQIKTLLVTLKDLQGNVIRKEQVIVSGGNTDELLVKDAVNWELGQDGVGLWWPVGYGEQNLYNVELALLGPVRISMRKSLMMPLNGSLSGTQTGHVVDSQVKRIGFRNVQLIQEPLTEADQYGTGSTFLFEVNGVRIFVGGT